MGQPCVIVRRSADEAHANGSPDLSKTLDHCTRTNIVLVLVLTCLLASPTHAQAQDPAVFYIGGAALAAVVPGFLFDLPQPDSERSFIKTSLGRFDAIDRENMALDFLVAYQPGITWHRMKPLIGMAGNSDGTVYAWASVAHDFHFAERLVVNVNTGPAVYIAGDRGKSLGSAGALRSGFEVGYRFGGGARFTTSFHHMSHGKLLNPELNPGTEVVAVNLSWPLH